MESIKEIYKIGHGPSSSHTMGPENACKYVLENYPNAKAYKVTLFGSLAFTGKGHLTDKIIKNTLGDKKTEIVFDYKTMKDHPNTMEILIDNTILLLVESIGGGSILINKKTVTQTQNSIFPFKNFEETKEYALKKNISLADIVYEFEGNSIKTYLNEVWKCMQESIKRGLSKEGYLPGGLNVLRKAKTLYNSNDESPMRYVSAYAFAVSEENASGELIVTCPTCGSCGVLPSVLYYYKMQNGVSDERIVDSLAVAGLMGCMIKMNASISGAEAGCQSEIGSACAMAAAALSFLENETIEEIEYSSEIALEHHLGLTCDPINGLVQIPCIERNAVAALRAIDAAKLAKLLKGTRKVSFDTVVKTMYETGLDLNQNYKETSVGGLAKNYQNN